MARADLPSSDGGYVVIPRRVGLATLVAVVVGGLGYACSAGVFALGLQARVNALEASDARLDAYTKGRAEQVDARFKVMDSERDRLIRLEAQLQYLTEGVRRIEGHLEPRRP